MFFSAWCFQPISMNDWLVLVGGFNHLEKYESQWEELILWKIKHVRNHQPDDIYWDAIEELGFA